MPDITKGKTFSSGDTVTASDLNSIVDDAVINNDAITQSKIASGAVVNDTVSAAANIVLSKLASGTDGQIPVCSTSGVPTYTTVSGDATISNLGGVTLATDSVVTTNITDLNVTTGKLADDAVTAAKLADMVGLTPAEYTSATVTIDQQGRITAASSGAGAGSQTVRVQGFTASGTWTSPAGVTRAKFTIVGGGGNAAVGSGSGGAGSTVIASVAVTASTAYSVSVGAASGTSSVVVGAITYSAGGGSASSGTTAGAGGTAGANGDIRLDGRSGIRFSSGGEMSPEIPAPVISHYGTGGLSAQSGSIQTNGQPGIVIVEWME